MSEDRSKAIAAVVSALTELRRTFDAEGASILDEIVVGEAAEVTGHAADFGAAVHGRLKIDDSAQYKLIDV